MSKFWKNSRGTVRFPDDQQQRTGWVLGCVLCLGLMAGCSRPAPPTPPVSDDTIPVRLASVTLRPLDQTIPVVGTLFPKDEAVLSAEVDGRVEKIMAEFGDRLADGQVVAHIDRLTYEAQVRQAEAALARTQASATNSSRELKRVQELSRSAIASASDLDQAQASMEVAQAEVKSSEAALAIARLRLEKSEVKAPYDCAVAERIVGAGDYVKAGSPVYRVVNDGVLKYIMQVPERYAGDIRKEQEVRFTVDAWPSLTFTGRVFLIGPAVNTTTRAFNIGALVANRTRQLKASTFGRGQVLVREKVPTLMVPLDALVSFAGITKVFIVENGLAKSRVVVSGRIQDQQQEILSGLKAGEQVVVSGQTKLYDGAKVKLADAGGKQP
jgi:RND family efflux transporter MFP subunit